MIHHVKTGFFIVGLTSCAVFGNQVDKNAVMLKIDYSGNQACAYSLTYSSQGTFKQKGSTSVKSTSVRSVLSIATKPEKRLAVAIDSVSIASDILTEDVQKEIKDKLLKSGASLSLTHGFPSIDSATELLAAEYMEWNLYSQLLKLLPAFPGKPIKAGFTWERTFTLPLQTARGKVPCEIYRFYTLDRIRGDTAIVRWKFTYSARKKSSDTADVLRHIPVAGKGNGSAVLDVRNHCILGIDMDFTTPVGIFGDISVTWTEKAALTLKNCR